MGAKRKGTGAELKTRRLLEADGAIVVRAAGSLGPIDLVALYPTCGAPRVVPVQVKCNRWPGNDEKLILRSIAKMLGVPVHMTRWDDYARIPRIQEVGLDGPCLSITDLLSAIHKSKRGKAKACGEEER